MILWFVICAIILSKPYCCDCENQTIEHIWCASLWFSLLISLLDVFLWLAYQTKICTGSNEIIKQSNYNYLVVTCYLLAIMMEMVLIQRVKWTLNQQKRTRKSKGSRKPPKGRETGRNSAKRILFHQGGGSHQQSRAFSYLPHWTGQHSIWFPCSCPKLLSKPLCRIRVSMQHG